MRHGRHAIQDHVARQHVSAATQPTHRQQLPQLRRRKSRRSDRTSTQLPSLHSQCHRRHHHKRKHTHHRKQIHVAQLAPRAVAVQHFLRQHIPTLQRKIRPHCRQETQPRERHVCRRCQRYSSDNRKQTSDDSPRRHDAENRRRERHREKRFCCFHCVGECDGYGAQGHVCEEESERVQECERCNCFCDLVRVQLRRFLQFKHPQKHHEQ
mmetsp:Transcript_10901/g.19692  ORF Transcript_10901/g.19692 Transcript_10901/m.19692 type:complete len:210 (+) Transcript_10901:483-1112(+)